MMSNETRKIHVHDAGPPVPDGLLDAAQPNYTVIQMLADEIERRERIWIERWNMAVNSGRSLVEATHDANAAQR